MIPRNTIKRISNNSNVIKLLSNQSIYSLFIFILIRKKKNVNKIECTSTPLHIRSLNWTIKNGISSDHPTEYRPRVVVVDGGVVRYDLSESLKCLINLLAFPPWSIENHHPSPLHAREINRRHIFIYVFNSISFD